MKRKPGRIKAALLDWLGIPLTLTSSFWSEIGTTAAGQTINDTTILKLSTVWACSRLVAETIATLPLGLFERTAKGRKSASQLSLYNIIHNQPNADSVASVFWESMVAAMLLRGNAFAEKLTIGTRLVGLKFLNPTYLTIQSDSNYNVKFFYTEKGKQREIPEARIFHIPGFTTNGKWGLSVVAYGAGVFGSALAADTAANSTFENGLSPTTALMVDRIVKPDQREAFRTSMALVTGAINAGKTPVLEQGMDIKTIGINPKDAQLLESRAFSVQEICRWFRVPPHMVGHSEKCLPAGEKVFTEFGPVNVEDVQPGDRVWSWNSEAGKLELQAVHHSDQTGVQPVLTIKTRTRTVRATANHRILVWRKCPAPRVGPGGYRGVQWREVWVEAGKVTTDDYLIGMNGVDTSGTDTLPNGRVLTERFMEFCGIYVAEGSMSDGHVSIARHAAAPYMDAYRAAMEESFVRCSRGGTLTRDGRSTETVTLRECERDTRFSSVHAVHELRELGLSGVARTKRIPGWVFAASKPMQLAFLRGYLDGDGSVNSRGWIAWSSCNRELVEDVRHLCFLVGVPCGEVRRYETDGEVWINGRKSQRGVMYQAWCYSAKHNAQIGSHTPLYLQRWEANAETTRVGPFDDGFKGRGPKGSRPGDEWNGSAALLKVHSIETSTAAMPVYDLGVCGTQSFVAGGLVVHNSTSWGTGIEQQMIGFLQFTLRPWLTRIEQHINKDLLTPAEQQRYYAEFNIEGLLRGDSAARKEFYASALQNGWMNRNQVAAMENQPSMDGGDIYTVQSNLIPIDQLGKGQPNETTITSRI